MLSVAVKYLKKNKYHKVALLSDYYWALDCEPDIIVNLQNALRWGRRRQTLVAQLKLASYSEIVLLGADVLDGVYGPEDINWRIAVVDQASRLGVKVSILGASFSEDPAQSTILALRSLPSSVTIFSRDPISLRRMVRLLEREITQAADLAFLLVQDRNHPAAAIAIRWIESQKASKRCVVGVNVNSIHDSTTPGFTNSFKEVVNRLLAANCSIIFIPHDSRTARSDSDILTEIRETLDDGNCSRGWQKKSCAETRDLIHPTDVDRTWHWAE